MSEPIQLPGPSQRTAIVGRTGSGKTLAAVWLLSESDFDERPWVIVDYKGDALINSIARAERINYGEIPEEPGIYILSVIPGDEDDGQLTAWFRKVWEHENIGLYIDEGYIIGPRDRWFNAILTQGRSKHIPAIVLSQRPVWLSKFVFSEADFFIVFDLTDEADRDSVRRYIRDDAGLIDRDLPKYHSLYYDVAERRLTPLAPVPEGAELLAAIDARLEAIEEIPTERFRAL
jgi:DNA helicase HerA-like ATPase